MHRSFGLLAPLLVALVVAIPSVSEGGDEQGGCAAGTHELTFLNSCSYTVWLAELGNTSAGSCTNSAECIAGLQTCNIPMCSGAADCPAIGCTMDSECPVAGQTCPAGPVGQRFCTPACQTGGNCACTTATGCPGGGVCGVDGVCGGGVCQFDTIAPTSWELQRNVPTKICIPKGWQGRFWGRTGCTPQDGGLQCRTGQCGPPYPATGELACTKSGNSPATLFEPTFDAPGPPVVDFYDVSLVGGYNVPIEVKPVSGACVASGSCTQDLNATCPAALQVLGPACTAGECPAGGACVDDTCVIGCLDPCEACGVASPPAELDCAANMDFYCCEGSQTSNSCNSASATCFDDGDCKNLSNGILQASCDATTNLCMKTCTGDSDCPGGICDIANGHCAPPLVSCATEACAAAKPPQPNPSCESTHLGDVCVPTSDCCGPYNPGWTAAAMVAGGGSTTWTSIFKAACPTAYSYQFDDPSSTFTCGDPTGGEVDYEITFCPVPEPAGWLQAAFALGALRFLQARRRIRPSNAASALRP